jgi:hypothetical protein
MTLHHPHDNRPGDRTCRASPLPSREPNLIRSRHLTLWHNGQYFLVAPEVIEKLGLQPRQEVDEFTLGRAIDMDREMMRDRTTVKG